MPAKTPIYLKTTTPKKGKKLKLRDILSGDMISPPLGDVRHSAHVGPEGEGDMFGDVGFLQGKMNMLPSNSRTQNGRSQSVERQTDDNFTTKQDSHNYSYNGYHYQHSPPGLLKTTMSMPVFIAHEQAPPKPPRLHLDDPSPPQQNHFHYHQAAEKSHKQSNGYGYTERQGHPGYTERQGHPGYTERQGHPGVSLFENGIVGRLASEPCRDISLSPTIRKLVPSSGSFSEVSSEDSMYEACGPLDVHRGLSLDSDAGLSNEDLMSERSESPCTPFQPDIVTAPSGVPRSESMAGLNLDLGPSILEDVLSIMDRYKADDNRCEL
ncbi:cdc42 effector protein 3 [Takifugu flavidus]|nr:cdc42 effector protein 3 [Takifugu flavidus]